MLASLIAMASNFLINNEITYRDRRRRGWGLLLGYIKFCALCSIGLLANLAVFSMVIKWAPEYPILASVAGTGFGALWNYMTTSVAVW